MVESGGAVAARRGVAARVGAVLVLMVLVGMGAGAGSLLSPSDVDLPALPPPPVQRPSPRVTAPTSPRDGAGPSGPPDIDVGTIFTVLAVAAVVALLAWLVVRFEVWRWRWRRGPGVRTDDWLPSDADGHSAARLREQIAASADDAATTGEPRQAVIACWIGLERAAEHAGVARRRSETSAELVRRVLAAHHVDRDQVDGLHASYRSARYSRAAVSARDAEQALAKLRAIQDQLHVEAAPGVVQ